MEEDFESLTQVGQSSLKPVQPLTHLLGRLCRPLSASESASFCLIQVPRLISLLADGDAKTEPLSGPSSLGPVYDEAWRRYHAIAEVGSCKWPLLKYKQAQAIIQKEEQLDIVEEWLERAKQPTLLASTSTARRLPMAIMKSLLA